MFQGVGKRLKRSQELFAISYLQSDMGLRERRVRRNDMKMRVLFIVGLPYSFSYLARSPFRVSSGASFGSTVKTKKFCERAVGTIELRDV